MSERSQPGRRRGDVYWYEFAKPVFSHMVVVVSRDTGRDAVLAAYMTNSPQPIATDIVRIDDTWDCYPTVQGWIRCDSLHYFEKTDKYWGSYVTAFSDNDMRKIEAGLRAALAL